jgi:hypothetical protein
MATFGGGGSVNQQSPHRLQTKIRATPCPQHVKRTAKWHRSADFGACRRYGTDSGRENGNGSLHALFAWAFILMLLAGMPGLETQTSILNVSHDLSRDLYKEINPNFIADWQQRPARRSW